MSFRSPTILAPLAVELDEMQMPHVKCLSKSRNSPDLISTRGDGVTLKRDLRPYGTLRAARAPDRRTQTAASGGAIPSVLQETSSGSEEIAFNPVAVQSPPLADSLLLRTHNYSTTPSRYGGVFQRTVSRNGVDWNAVVFFEQPISRKSVGFRLLP